MCDRYEQNSALKANVTVSGAVEAAINAIIETNKVRDEICRAVDPEQETKIHGSDNTFVVVILPETPSAEVLAVFAQAVQATVPVVRQA